jgi:FSR family fosmidomycin resistance protein-like MFS transporter
LSIATICRSIVFYGFNTFLSLYFMSRWNESAAEASRASVVFLGTSIFGTLLGGWLADRVGRRTVVRWGFGVGTLLFAIFTRIQDETWALASLVPLAIFIFMPTSVLVVLGQEYLPNRVGMASGVTLGLAVSVGGMCAPLLGIVADHYGISSVLFILTAMLLVATLQTFLLPAVGSPSQPEPSEACSVTLSGDPTGRVADYPLPHPSASREASGQDFPVTRTE